jgi:hypothetical protein
VQKITLTDQGVEDVEAIVDVAADTVTFSSPQLTMRQARQFHTGWHRAVESNRQIMLSLGIISEPKPSEGSAKFWRAKYEEVEKQRAIETLEACFKSIKEFMRFIDDHHMTWDDLGYCGQLAVLWLTVLFEHFGPGKGVTWGQACAEADAAVPEYRPLIMSWQDMSPEEARANFYQLNGWELN